MIQLTNEQKNIINFIKGLYSIKKLKGKKILFLLINKMLKIDLYNKINKIFKKEEKDNIVSNNYHSFVIEIYNQINGTYSDMINVCEKILNLQNSSILILYL